MLPQLTTVLITCDHQRGCLEALREDGSVSIKAIKSAPEWARGITKVLVQSRLAFYRSRVTDPEWRMEFLAGLHGVTRSAELDQESYGPDASIRAQVEIGMDGARTSDEEAAHKLAQATLKRRRVAW